MNRRPTQPLTIRDRPAEPPTTPGLVEAREREMADSIFQCLVAPLPTPASPPGPTVSAAAVQPPRSGPTEGSLETAATPRRKGGEDVA